MIDLSKTHILNPIANSWWIELNSFLFDKREGRARPYYYNCRGERTPCDSFYQKMVEKSLLGLSGDGEKVVKLILDSYKANCKAITLADNNKLQRLAIEYRTSLLRLDVPERKKVNDQIAEVFAELYESFVKIHGYNVLVRLNVMTCPFCNRQFVTVCKEAKVRPDFDHFLPKSCYPTLAVSFFNLVPICSTCNKTKGARRIIIHPYFCGAKMEFYAHEKGDIAKKSLANLSRLSEGQLEVSISSSDMASKRSLNILRTKAIYNTHRYYISNIISKAYAYDRHACDALVGDFAANSGSPQDVYNFVWGPYLDLRHQEEMPLSKLTADILDEFGIK